MSNTYATLKKFFNLINIKRENTPTTLSSDSGEFILYNFPNQIFAKILHMMKHSQLRIRIFYNNKTLFFANDFIKLCNHISINTCVYCVENAAGLM